MVLKVLIPCAIIVATAAATGYDYGLCLWFLTRVCVAYGTWLLGEFGRNFLNWLASLQNQVPMPPLWLLAIILATAATGYDYGLCLWFMARVCVVYGTIVLGVLACCLLNWLPSLRNDFPLFPNPWLVAIILATDSTGYDYGLCLWFMTRVCVVYGTIVLGVFVSDLLKCSPSFDPGFGRPAPTYTPWPAPTNKRTKCPWSKVEGYEATAAAFSAISGVKIISEKDVEKQRWLGKPVKRLEIKDIFFKKPSTFWDGKGQEPLYYIPDSVYDPQYDQDFTNYKGDDDKSTRGGYRYTRPSGWNRKAVKVLGKYKDDIWLGQDGMRSGSSPGEWPVSYHGTKIHNVASIVTGGYDTNKCVNNRYGLGIYSTPDLKVAEDYATEFNYKGERCTCILQNRVNLKKTKVVQTNHGTYFCSPNEDDIRPYGVCIKKI